MSIYDWMHVHGFSEKSDAPLYEYAERWTFNNQFMEMDDPAAFFATSAGVTEYLATGQVTPEDD